MNKTGISNMSVELEWIQLLKEAKEIGLTPQDIRQFFLSRKTLEHSNNCQSKICSK